MPAFETTRETTTSAAPATVRALVEDFHQWAAWSPWEELDPEQKRTFTGADKGVGARYAWAGNKKIGEGSMQITSATPEQIAIDLEFLRPFKASNKAVFRFTPAGGGTKVSWTMSGNRPLMFAILGKLVFDKMIAKDFDKGLAKLKAAAERA